MVFNAWRDAWVPVQTADAQQAVLSLRDLYLRAHQLQGLGRGLTPLDLDSLHRFLPAVGALIARGAGDLDEVEDLAEEGTFPAALVDEFGATYAPLFDLAGPKPFLQRWDRTPEDLSQLVLAANKNSKKPTTLADLILPLEQLHPHEPGASSSKWAVRRDAREVGSWDGLALLLVTAWFQTKNGNSKDPWGGNAGKGSVGTWHTNPMSLFLIDSTSLGRTIFANMPPEWVTGTDLPAFFAHDGQPSDWATNPRGLWRCTYARTLPLLAWEVTQDAPAANEATVEAVKPVGFVLGADTTMPVPVLGKDIKESLGLVHAEDHTRLYTLNQTKGMPAVLNPRGAFSARVTSTEGFERWFRAETGISGSTGAFNRWKAQPRLAEVGELEGWDLAIFSESTNGKGARRWCTWSQMPGRVAYTTLREASAMQALTALAAACKRAIYTEAKTATGDPKAAAITDRIQAAFYSHVEPALAGVIRTIAAGDSPLDLRATATAITDAARAAFRAGTEPLATPHTLPRVAVARGGLDRRVRRELDTRFPRPETSREDAA